MFRGLALVALLGCSSSSAAVLVTTIDGGAGAGADAGASSSSGDPGDEQGVPDEPLPECIETSIGIWDDFEAPADGSQLVSQAGGQIAFDPVHHCGAQGLKIVGASGTTGETAFFDRSVPAISTPTKAVSWSFLVRFAAAPPAVSAFAALALANGGTLSFEYDGGKLSLVEKHADKREVHANLGALPLNEWVRIDMRLDYATKNATLKIGPPGGTAPTQEQPLAGELAAVTRETLGPNFNATVHYDRAAIYVE